MNLPQWLPRRNDAAGYVLAFGVAAIAMGLARALPASPFVSDILIALLLGVVVLNTPLRSLVGLEPPGRDREPDRHAAGLRHLGKWVLRLSIILMGLKVKTGFFGAEELALIGGVIVAALPSTLLIAHAAGARLGVRGPMTDLLAGGTMICGASAVSAIAPVVGARRNEQGVAIAAVFLFSVAALIAFHPIAEAVGLDSAHAGLWSGLAVNDLSSAIAVGKQMGGDGGVMAAAAKSARVLMLAPVLIAFALWRGGKLTAGGVGAAVPRYLFGYVALAALRAAGDRVWPGDAWTAVLDANKLVVDVLLLAVAASIGLHLEVRTLLGRSARAIVVGGAASLWMAGLTFAMIVLAARDQPAASALVGVGGVAISAAIYALATRGGVEARALQARFAAGRPLSLAEAKLLLDGMETAEGDGKPRLGRGAQHRVSGAEHDRVQVLRQTYPSIGELIPARASPLAHGDGSRWTTYWHGASGWALVAVVRDPGSITPIHSHSHRLYAKTLEGVVEELSFEEQPGEVILTGRKHMTHDELVEAAGPSVVHVIRNASDRIAIDLQLRGPEQGGAGRHLRPVTTTDLAALSIGARLPITPEDDARPGHGGEGPSGGRWSG